MLSTLRRHSRSTLIYVLFGIIIAAFILTFNTMGPTQGCGSPGSIRMAEVGDVTIDAGLLQMGEALTVDPPTPGDLTPQSLQAQMWYESTRFVRGNPNMDLMRYMPAREMLSPIKYRRVMDDLIETYLVSQTAEELGFQVPEAELAIRLYENPALRDYWYDEDGRFDKRRFLNFAQYYLRTSAGAYEDFLRRELLREKLIEFLASQVKISPAEVDAEWTLQNEKVSLAFVEFAPEVVGRTLTVPPADLQKALEERKDAIAAYYEEHKGQFEKEERARVHGIFLQAPLQSRIERAEGDEKAQLEAERTAARAKAEEVLAELTKAPEPAPAPAPAPAPEEAPTPDTAAAPTDPAEPGAEPSPPGPAETTGAAEAPPDPVERFEALAKEHSQHLGTKDEGGAFGELKPRSAFGIWPFGAGVADAVFALAPGQLTGVVEVPNGFWILRVDEKLPAEKRPLESVREEIARQLVVEERVAAQTKEQAEAFLATATAAKDKSLADLVAEWNAAHPVVAAGDDEAGPALTVRETGAFALASPVPGGGFGTVPMIGPQEELARAAFRLTEEAPLVDRAYSVERGGRTHWFVARLDERLPADDTNAAEDKAALRERLLAQRQIAHYRAWYAELLRAAFADGDVKESEDFQALVASEQRRLQEAMERVGGRQAGSPMPINLPIQP
jgi:peptidyl-prolyl cis-trans isomerase D